MCVYIMVQELILPRVDDVYVTEISGQKSAQFFLVSGHLGCILL